MGGLSPGGAEIFDDGQIPVGVKPGGALIIPALNRGVIIQFGKPAGGFQPGDVEEGKDRFGGGRVHGVGDEENNFEQKLAKIAKKKLIFS
jgi:hypothetical protein